jgi:hypothetical protein
MGRNSATLRSLATAIVVMTAQPLSAETVYEFAVTCHEDQLRACFDRIEERLDRVKAKEQGRAFCIPRAWGSPYFISTGYQVSILEYLRLGLSAARFGRAEQPVEDAIRDLVKQIYPCD